MNTTIRPFALSDEAAVIAVWRACGLTHPNNDPRKDIARKMKVNPELFLVCEIDGKIVGTVMIGYEGHRGWINYLGVLPEYQGQGLGRQLMDQAEALLVERGCAKINLQIRATNTKVIQFYAGIGFNVDEVVSMGKRLNIDNVSQ
ncbi:MAG: GNAT family acetyltransferase [Chloroflexi bacterium]|nr:GNAT family acetyltransferase [Chloroflexota bacterium]